MKGTSSNIDNVWLRIFRLCRKLHKQVYEESNADLAKENLPELDTLLTQLPCNVEAIVHAEALALYYELTGNIAQAIAQRNREIKLMEELFFDIQRNNYSHEVKSILLDGRNIQDLDYRKKIVTELEQRLRKEERKGAG